MAEGLSLREFGSQIGVSGEAVRKAIATGKIPRECVGEKTLRSGKKQPLILHPDRAADHWGRNRDPNQVRDKATLSRAAQQAWSRRRGEEPDDEDDAPPPPSAGLRAGSSLPDINESKRREAAAKAQMAVLDLKERQGELVNAHQLKAKLVQMITSSKTRLLAVPTKAKARIHTLTMEDIETLEELIVEALEELASDQ